MRNLNTCGAKRGLSFGKNFDRNGSDCAGGFGARRVAALRRWLARAVLWAMLATVALPALAADFRQVSEHGTILYDGPSTKSTRLFILGSGMPVEVIVSVSGWVKVRDASGSLGWVEPKQLAMRTNVQVKANTIAVRAQPSESAPSLFAAEKDVLLNLADTTPTSGWIKVSHKDGGIGYVRIESIFGI